MKTQTRSSPNGLGLHLIEMVGTQTVTVMLSFDAGTRAETKDENGMAHFLEHLVFKGGEKFTTPQAVNHAAEAVGAELNAYTSHDLVCFFLTGRAQSVMALVDLLSDFVARASLKEEEIDHERGVVIQEIAMYNDDPASVADTLLEAAAFGDHPLGRPILGPTEHIENFSSAQIRAFRDRRWVASRAGLYLAGNLSHVDFGQLDELAARVSSQAEPEPLAPAPDHQRRVLVEERDTAQSHLRLGWRLSDDFDARDLRQRAILGIYSTVFGGSMGSRLFDEIRERRGLCYHISSWPELHSDATELRLRSGLETTRTVEAYERICAIAAELMGSQPPSDEEIERAKQVVAGQFVRQIERSFTIAAEAAQETIVFGQEPDILGMLAAYDSIEADEVRRFAEQLPLVPSVACVGQHQVSDFA